MEALSAVDSIGFWYRVRVSSPSPAVGSRVRVRVRVSSPATFSQVHLFTDDMMQATSLRSYNL